MWLLPAFSAVSRICLGVYYRVEVDGPRPPESGPLILVANHPNSLLDPACVVAFAERPVRFLAKAPLFDQRDIGWLIRGSGSIPVYRPQDDPSRVGENDQTFRAAEDALLQGSAIGIFPEGITHDEPSLSVLKTGGARIALATALRHGSAFPIVPMGLSFPEKAIFRSDALVVRGRPIAWADLAGTPATDAATVRELTKRIEEGLRSVTLNLEQWEDREVVLGAEAIYSAEHNLDRAHARRMERLRVATERLRQLRAAGAADHVELADGVRRHMMRLGRLGLTPYDVASSSDGGGSGVLASGAAGVAGAIALPLAWIGGVVFYPPYRLIGSVQRLFEPDNTAAATHKLLAGILFFTIWYLLLVGLVGFLAGWQTAALAALILPPTGIATLWMRDLSNEALRRAQKGWVLKSGGGALESIRDAQKTIAARLRQVLEDGAVPGAPIAANPHRASGVQPTDGTPPSPAA